MTIHIPACRHEFFQFFQIFFNVEAVLQYSKSLFFNILYPASANEFSAYEKQYFFGQSFFAAIRND